MHQTLEKLYNVQFEFQSNLFPEIKEELGDLSKLQQKFVQALEISQLDAFIPYIGKRKCRPTKSRMALARAFLAKSIYNMATTEILIERLNSDLSLRRLCGYERRNQLPSQSTFSRAFKEFAEMGLADKVHEYIINEYFDKHIVGHISRDSTAINAREKPIKVPNKETNPPKKRGRPKKGEVRTKELTRLEKQSLGMTIKAMLLDLPMFCNIGTKKNSKGYKTSWQGYKLHIDCSDNEFLVEHVEEVKAFNVVKGFLNIEISDAYYLNFFNSIKANDTFGFCEENTNKKAIMVEYASPNTNKPLHLGHVRNVMLGYSVANILKASGRKVYKTQIINDRGI
ncbi:Arginyl-tRNA synthetase, partial [hydrothermal vent metagenome]